MALGALTAASGAAQPPDWRSKIAPPLRDAARESAELEFLVEFDGTADLSGAAALPTKSAKGQYVYDTLRSAAATSQAAARQLLDDRGATYRPYWVTNMIWVRGSADLLHALAQMPEVSTIVPNPTIQLDQPAPGHQDARAALDEDVLWNLIMVNAPDVWAAGFEGQGIVVGGQDTGVDWTHPALKAQYRGWDGTTADHDYNWHDAIRSDNPNTGPGNPCGFDLPAPCDDGYHGTHTMGTMVGDDGAGRRVGVVPRARWMACRNMEQEWGTPASYAECFEWFIAPYPIGGDPFTDGDPSRAPHVINNSWSCPPVEGCTPGILEPVVNAVRAAGIVTVQSAGNSGPGCATVATPAAIYDASLTVGGVSNTATIASFSSRGPASGLLKPDLVAPGQGVESTTPGGGYGSLSGTSMASPHVAGVVALLLSADPALSGDVAAIEAALTQTAVARTTSQGCGGDADDAVPNNVYGWGLVNAAEAVAQLPDDPFTIYAPFGVLGP